MSWTSSTASPCTVDNQPFPHGFPITIGSSFGTSLQLLTAGNRATPTNYVITFDIVGGTLPLTGVSHFTDTSGGSASAVLVKTSARLFTYTVTMTNSFAGDLLYNPYVTITDASGISMDLGLVLGHNEVG